MPSSNSATSEITFEKLLQDIQSLETIVSTWSEHEQMTVSALKRAIDDLNKEAYQPVFVVPETGWLLQDWLIVADTANSRLLGWHKDHASTAGGATALFGQKDFHEKGDNRWQPTSSNSLCWPYGVQAIDDMLVISDSGNNRVSIWRIAL